MKKILISVATCVCLMATSGFALTINSTGVVGAIDGGTASVPVATVTPWANHLLSMGASETDVTTDADGDGTSESYTTSSTDYNGTLTGGLRIDGATPSVGAYEYVLGKYDGQSAGFVLFNMAALDTNTIPEFSYNIWGANAEQYQLSNVTVWGENPGGGGGGNGAIPEPTTILMVGIGLLGVAFAGRRKLRK